MAKRKQGPVSKAKGVYGVPFSPGAPAGSPVGARPNFQTTTRDGRDVIPRRTVNGTGRTNMWLEGGIDG